MLLFLSLIRVLQTAKSPMVLCVQSFMLFHWFATNIGCSSGITVCCSSVGTFLAIVDRIRWKLLGTQRLLHRCFLLWESSVAGETCWSTSNFPVSRVCYFLRRTETMQFQWLNFHVLCGYFWEKSGILLKSAKFCWRWYSWQRKLLQEALILENHGVSMKYLLRKDE